MIKKNSILSIFIISLLSSVNSIASSVDATIQFKNEDSKNMASITSTMQPYLDNFSWTDSRPEYQATWNFPTQTQFFQNTSPLITSFKNVDKFALAPQESAVATLSYYAPHNSYGMSQYAFNYEGRSKEYGCFVTELRLSGVGVDNYNVVIAAYRQDPQHLDKYLTCFAEKNSLTSFTIHMTSSINKKDEQNISDDSKRYSLVGGDTYLMKTGEVLKTLNEYGIDLPIELWKDQTNHLAFVLRNNQPVPVIVPLQPSQLSPKNISTIELINNTSEVLVAGQPLLDKFSRLSSEYDLEQPAQVQPAQSAAIKLASAGKNHWAFARLNYHFANDAEDSGCYITAELKGYFYSTFWTVYRFDAKHIASQKNLYCFISNPSRTQLHKITVTFYEYPTAVREITLPASITSDPYVSYSSFVLNHHFFYRTLPTYDRGEQLTQDNDKYSNYQGNFPIDPTHHFSVTAS